MEKIKQCDNGIEIHKFMKQESLQNNTQKLHKQ